MYLCGCWGRGLCFILFAFVGLLQQCKHMKTGYISSWPVAPYDLFPSLSAKNAHLKLSCVLPNIQALEAEHMLGLYLKQFKGCVVLDLCVLSGDKFHSSDFTVLDEQISQL